jgi:hypothetical protein
LKTGGIVSKEKHLEMIQNVINRMTNNSFLVKGWSIVLVTALFVLAGKDTKLYFVYLGFFPALSFFFLDGYYTWQEKLYRELYDDVRTKQGETDYSLDASPYKEKVKSWFKTCFSSPLIILHGAIIITIVMVLVLSMIYS